MTRIKETLKKSDKIQSQSLDIPDQPGHYYSLSTETMLATGAEPSEIEGESLLDNKIAWYVTYERWEGGKFINHGYWERVMPSGDRIFHTFDGQSGNVQIVGGTGKFAGIKGEGLYKGEVKHAGVWQASFEWEYEL